MQTTFRSNLRPADIVKLVIGSLLLLVFTPALLGAPFWIPPYVAAADGEGMACGLVVLLAFIAGLAFTGWTLLPTFRRAEVSFRPDGLTLSAYGRQHDIPWHAVRSLRLEELPVAHWLFGNGPNETWHLVATAEGLGPFAVPLDTFHVDLDEIVAAFQRVAPGAVELELEGDVAGRKDPDPGRTTD